jgi:hypothetical protein
MEKTYSRTRCVASLALALGAVALLPTTCAADDESRPGCSHY